MPTHRVTLSPSQHQYLASSKQSLLRAGLESGLNLVYGCAGGNCGECLSRLKSGSIERIKHSDFVLTQEQKEKRQFLSCCYAATSDVEMEATEIGSVSEIAEQRIDARVYRLDRLSESVISMVLKTPRSQPLRFLAGQYVRLSINPGLLRNKSIASCPCDGLSLEFHVKKKQHDPFSEHVFTRLKKNERVTILGPRGQFVLDDESNRPLLLIAYDTGFASIKSLIEHAVALQKEQPITLYWILSAGNQPYLENYCRSIAHALDNFSFQSVFISQATSSEINRVMGEILAQQTMLGQSRVYLTLPQEFQAGAQQMFGLAGLQPQHWVFDSIPTL